jgi:hypothetical protein
MEKLDRKSGNTLNAGINQSSVATLFGDKTAE